MNDMFPISYIMPAYNSEDTVAVAIASIFDGNFEDGDECIIVNDGSTDGTFIVLEELQKKYPMMRIIDNLQNIGCPASRNVGIRASSNPLIFNLDADNILIPGSVRTLRDALVRENADIASFADFLFFKNTPSNVTHTWVCRPGVMTLADFLAGPTNPGPDGNFLYTRASSDRIGGYWEYGKGLHEAWGFTLKQLAHGAKFFIVPHTQFFHRYGTDSLFVRENKKTDESGLMATKMIMPFLDQIDPEDVAYIRSDEGSRIWFDSLGTRPIRLASGEKGTSGYVRLCARLMIIKKLKQFIPKKILGWLGATKDK